MANSVETSDPAIEAQQESVPGESPGVAKSLEPSSSDIPADMVQFFKDTLPDNDATFVVFYRGLWWPYCKGYLVEFNQLYEEFRGKKVGIYAVCAEPQNQVDECMKQLGLHYKCYSDLTHTLRNYFHENDYVSPRISGGENSTDSNFYKIHPKIKEYKHGMVQPAVLCITNERKVLFSWAIDPSVTNLGGASHRPIPADIWGIVQTKLADLENADSVPVNYDRLRRRGICSICAIQ